MKAKICGLTEEIAVKAAIDAGADYIGFVFFAKSVRNINPKKAASLCRKVPNSVKTVAVVVNPSDDDLDNILEVFDVDYIQCHGDESPERIYDLHIKYAKPVIKAVPVQSSDDIAKGKGYANVADMLLFDAKAPTTDVPGGNGISFDWTLLKAREFLVPWFLSGGLSLDNVVEAIEISGAKLVDVSSSLESEPGVKDPELIRLFLERVKNL